MKRPFATALATVLVASIVPAAAANGGATTAAAGSSQLSIGFIDPGTPVSITDIPVRVSGGLTLSFHGDAASGCAAHGLCGYSGTIVWQPPRTGNLTIETFRKHGKIEHDSDLELSMQGAVEGPSVQGGVTTSDVRFVPSGAAAPASTCTDATTTGTSLGTYVRGATMSVALAKAAPDLVGTRCAGPVAGDLARALATRSVPVRAALHGHVRLSLGSTGAFAGHGFAGTANSTVSLALGRPKRERLTSPAPSGPTRRFRSVEVDYRSSLTGALRLQVHGDPASCAALGSCGADGAFAASGPRIDGRLEVSVFTTARRPLRDVLTALGLRRGGNPRGITAFGVFVAARRGTDDAQFTQGANSCTDTGPAGPAAIELVVSGGVANATLLAPGAAMHLRCPGPAFSNGTALATGSAALGRRSTIRLRTGRSVSDDGYAGRTVSTVAITLSHPRVKSHVQSVPIP
jgi:hypothetical protein